MDRWNVVLVLLFAIALGEDRASAQALPLDKIKLPPGFTIELVARVDNARAMTLGREGHAVRRIDAGRKGLRVAHAKRRRPSGHHDRVQSQAARRSRLSRWRALRVGSRPYPPLRRHRRPSGRSAGTRRRQRSFPERNTPRLEIHRLRSRRQALRSSRRAMQHLRTRSRSLREYHAHEPGRVGARGVRARRAQYRGLRLGSAQRRVMVHRQRPRHARRRSSSGRAQSRGARR